MTIEPNGRRAVIVVDMLEDFIYGSLGCPSARKVVEPIKELIEAARENNVPVIYANDAHDEKDYENNVWGTHALKGAKGAQVVKELEPTNRDYIVEKQWYDPFTNTNLEEILEKEDINTIIITGMHADICDRHTAYEAFKRKLGIIVAKDCVGVFDSKDEDETKKRYEAALGYFEMAYGAKIETVDELIKEMK